MDYYLLGWIGAIALIVLGFLGNILPLLPGAPLLVAGFVMGAWLDDFQRVGGVWLAVLVALGVLLAVIDFVSGAWGAKKVGASKHAVIGATIGSIVGIFFGLIGILLGPFVGAFAGELMVKSDITRAGNVGFATWLGIVIGAVAKVGLSLMMIAMFAFAYLF